MVDAAQAARIQEAFLQAGKRGPSQRFANAGKQNSTMNVPQSSAVERYVISRDRERPQSKIKYGEYRPLVVTQEGGRMVVERYGLLRKGSDRYERHEPYVQERIVYDENGEVVLRQVYTTYRDGGRQERSYLRTEETPQGRREIRRDDTGAKVSDVKAGADGSVRSERFGAEYQSPADLAQERRDQRDAFVASGASQQASAQERQGALARVQAQLDREGKGGSVITQVSSAQGESYQGRLVGGQFLGVRTVTAQEDAQAGMRSQLVAGLSRDNRGNTVLVREGTAGGQTAGELFTALGAPRREVTGDLLILRRNDTTIGEDIRNAFLGREAPVLTAAGTGQRFTTTYTVPNAASAALAGFPQAESYPATYVGTEYVVRGFERPSFFAEKTPRIYTASEFVDAQVAATDKAAREWRGLPLFGNPLGEVQRVGRAVEYGGKMIQAGGDAVQSRVAPVSQAEILKNQENDFGGELMGGVRLAGRDLAARFGLGTGAVGATVRGEGEALQERPLTVGLSDTALVAGGAFGAFERGSVAIKEAGYFTNLAGETVPRAGRWWTVGRGVGRTGEALAVGSGVVLGGAYAIEKTAEVKSAPDELSRGRVVAGALNEVGGFGVGAKVGGALAASGFEFGARTAGAVRRTAAIEAFNYQNRNQLITPEKAGELARISRELSTEVEVEPALFGVSVSQVMERGGLSVRESGSAIVLGSPQRVSGSDLADLGGEFLVRRGTRSRSVTLAENRGPLGAEDVEGLPQVGGVVGRSESFTNGSSLVRGEELIGEGARFVRLSDVQEGKADILNIQEVGRSWLGRGLRRQTQSVTLETFTPFVDTGARDLMVVPSRASESVQARRLGFQPKEVAGPAPKPILERVVRFTQEPGPTEVLAQTREGVLLQRGRAQVAINERQGRFKLLEFTEFRKFLYGTKGMPGRPVLSEGTFEPSQQPLVFKGLRRSKPVPKPKGDSMGVTVGESDAGGQVLLQKQSTKSETRQEQKLKQEPLTVTEERVRLDQRQEAVSVQERESVLARRLRSENRFSSLVDAQSLARKLRAVPSSRGILASSTRVRSVQVQAQASRSEQTAASQSASLVAQSQAVGQSGKFASGLRTEFSRVTGSSRGLVERLRGEEIEPLKPTFLEDVRGERARSEEGFTVLVKRFGRFEKVSNVSLSRGAALRLGQQVVDTGASQTFKLVRSGERVRGDGGPSFLSRKFKSIGNDTFRERRGKNLIDTPGELGEITYKGLVSRRGGLRV